MPCIVAQPQLSALRVVQAAKKRDFMTGSTVVHSEVRSSMLSSARIAFTQQYGELMPSLHHVCVPPSHPPFLKPQDGLHTCRTGALSLDAWVPLQRHVLQSTLAVGRHSTHADALC